MMYLASGLRGLSRFYKTYKVVKNNDRNKSMNLEYKNIEHKKNCAMGIKLCLL